MRSLSPFLLYFLYTAGATASGIFYSMALDNMKHHEQRSIHVFVLSLMLTPLGAWFISTITRIKERTTHNHT